MAQKYIGLEQNRDLNSNHVTSQPMPLTVRRSCRTRSFPSPGKSRLGTPVLQTRDLKSPKMKELAKQ